MLHQVIRNMIETNEITGFQLGVRKLQQKNSRYKKNELSANFRTLKYSNKWGTSFHLHHDLWVVRSSLTLGCALNSESA